MTEPTIEQLLSRCRDGDDLAWEMFVRTYQGRIFRIAYSHTRDREDARDLAQEIFIRIYRNLKTFRADQAAFAWIVTIARNMSIDYLRKKVRRPPRHDIAIDETYDPVSPEANPEQACITESRRCLVHRALDSISAVSRDIIMMKDLQGFRMDEIAAAMKIPLGTVKSRSNKARLELAKGGSVTSGSQLMKAMTCADVERLLQAIFSGALTEDQKQAVHRHIESCSQCADLVGSLVSDSPDQDMPNPDGSFADSVLARTSGPACRQAMEVFFAAADDVSPDFDTSLLDMHTKNCPDCRRIQDAWSWIDAECRYYRRAEPDDRFTHDVLRETSQRARPVSQLWDAFVHALSRRLAERPRIAWEISYALVVIIILIAGPLHFSSNSLLLRAANCLTLGSQLVADTGSDMAGALVCGAAYWKRRYTSSRTDLDSVALKALNSGSQVLSEVHDMIDAPVILSRIKSIAGELKVVPVFYLNRLNSRPPSKEKQKMKTQPKRRSLWKRNIIIKPLEHLPHHPRRRRRSPHYRRRNHRNSMGISNRRTAPGNSINHLPWPEYCQ